MSIWEPNKIVKKLHSNNNDFMTPSLVEIAYCYFIKILRITYELYGIRNNFKFLWKQNKDILFIFYNNTGWEDVS